MKHAVYLVPGRGNRLHEIGEIITSFGRNVSGRELIPPLSNYGISDQVEIIQNDLLENLRHPDTKLIGHSYGGYLLLPALLDLDPFPGDMLLLSPVLGPSMDKERRYISYPPRAKKIFPSLSRIDSQHRDYWKYILDQTISDQRQLSPRRPPRGANKRCFFRDSRTEPWFNG